MTYHLDEHRHRFAVWAAARAAQRGFTTVGKLRDALHASGVRRFLATTNLDSVDEAVFEKDHRLWCKAIISSLVNAGVEKATFGRAAKLIAVYLKSAVILGPRHASSLNRVAHPPIDRILLSQLVRSADVASPHKAEWAKISWTHLAEEDYYTLIKQLRMLLAPDEPFWMLERYWIVTNEDEL